MFDEEGEQTDPEREGYCSRYVFKNFLCAFY